MRREGLGEAGEPHARWRARGVVAMTWAKAERFGAKLAERLPLGFALSMVAAVWALGCVWSFTEQTAFARAKGFADPALLPLVIDGLAVSMAAVAFAASLDGRPALAARLGTALAVTASAASNGLWAAERSSVAASGPDLPTVVVGAGIPLAANIAFEVLLAELRRQVQRRRGLPAPAPLPTLRVARLLLAPASTFRTWRCEVLEVTAAVKPPLVLESASSTPGDGPRGPDGQGSRGGDAAATGDGEPAPNSSPLAAPSPASASAALESLPIGTNAAAACEEPSASAPEGPASGPASPSDEIVVSEFGSPAPAQATPPAPAHPPRGSDADQHSNVELPSEQRSEAEQAPETNPKVWRLADYLRESGLDPERVTGELVVELGLCSSPRNGRRLAGRAGRLCAALSSPNPPPRPDVSGVPRLLLPGEAPTLALVAREESR